MKVRVLEVSIIQNTRHYPSFVLHRRGTAVIQKGQARHSAWLHAQLSQATVTVWLSYLRWLDACPCPTMHRRGIELFNWSMSDTMTVWFQLVTTFTWRDLGTPVGETSVQTGFVALSKWINKQVYYKDHSPPPREGPPQGLWRVFSALSNRDLTCCR